MKINNHKLRRGFGSVAIIGIIAVLFLGGGAYFLTSGENKAENMDKNPVSQETSEDMDKELMDDVSHETDTMMKDDPKLKEMDPSDLAADGFNADVLPTDPNEPGPDLDGYLIVGDDTEIDGAYLPEEQPGEYVSYSGDLSYAETGDVILFFHADWCPSCRGLDSDIKANMNTIPDGVSIQKLNYDEETELKKKYGVVRQHTLIHVNESGEAIKTLTGLTNTLDQVVSQL